MEGRRCRDLGQPLSDAQGKWRLPGQRSPLSVPGHAQGRSTDLTGEASRCGRTQTIDDDLAPGREWALDKSATLRGWPRLRRPSLRGGGRYRRGPPVARRGGYAADL